MAFFNRIVVILLILATMILVPALLVFPEQAILVFRYVADILQANVDWLQSLAPGAMIGMRLILSALGMIIFVAGGLLLIVEIFRIRRNTVKLKDGSGELMMNGIEGLLSYHIDLLPDVLLARPAVQSVGQGVRVVLYVETAPGINIPKKADHVKATAREVIEDQLGLEVKGEIKVIIKPSRYSNEGLDKKSLQPLKEKAEPNGMVHNEAGQSLHVSTGTEKDYEGTNTADVNA
jgi:hypothetical protein